MRAIETGELVLIRHAPADHGGRLCGRTDVPALLPAAADLAHLRAALAGAAVVASPALRCQQTAAALCPGAEITTDTRLWEQDFGSEDGLPFNALPDLGPLPRPDLAARRPQGGESFLDMCARVTPVLNDLGAAAHNRPVAVIAHAGTARAALGLALGDAAQGLAFTIAPLSLTRLRRDGADWTILSVNETL
ncbi:histidine phosphatase family protein [Paracoccaceae bacterium GXU_MW_L88]